MACWFLRTLGVLVALTPALVAAQAQGISARGIDCSESRNWNTPHAPLRVFGNTYYVGTHCLSAILITSPAGHVLIDGGLPGSAPLILRNIASLGFRARDVKLILNSHVHFDHAGGIAALQQASGASVAASASSARVLESGAPGADDPQLGLLEPIARVRAVRVVTAGDTLRVGPLALVMHRTAGHTPGSTTWSWRSCEGARCVDVVYADSQTPVSADGFFYSRSTTYPRGVQDFTDGQALLERLRCDLLITPHPGASAFWERIAARGTSPALIDPDGCRRYAATARAALTKRLATEAKAR